MSEFSAELIPESWTAFEHAQERADAERYGGIPVHLIRDVWNPAACPLDLLPYLAWGLGLEIWKDSWSEAKKRDVVSRIWDLKRRKTTLKGISNYVALTDAEVVKAHRPRDRMWWAPSMSEAERAAIFARMPEIRIYPAPPVAEASPGQAFWSYGFWGWSCWTPDDAMARWLDRAAFVEDGVETRVVVTRPGGAIDASWTIMLRAQQAGKAFYGPLQFAPGAFRTPSDASDHVVAISPQDDAPGFAVPPGLTATSVRPERFAETVAGPVWKAFHWPSFFNYSFRTPSDAAERLYDRLRFIDPAKVGSFGRPMSFWGWSRSAPPAFTAELTLRVPLTRPAWAFAGFWGVGFWRATDMTPLWDAVSAVFVAQAARDEIGVSLRAFREVTFRDGLVFGEFDFGDWKKAA